MSQPQELEKRFHALPPEAQQQILDFLAFLEQRYRGSQQSLFSSEKPLRSYTFVGLWRDRKDMDDSIQWVRDLRHSEWRE